jgi:protein-disulfide isomerase
MPRAALLMLSLVLGAPADAADILIRAGGPMRGEASAPVTLIEYSDFTCGYCSKFFHETWPRLHAKYVATGKVRFVYRDYPRGNSGPGLDAAVTARCAGEQDRYWMMHDYLFTRAGRVPANEAQRYAGTVGIEPAAFARCLDDRRHAERAFEDRAEAAALGFRGTPGFVILLTERPDREPAVLIPGAVAYEVFEQQIERLLKTAVPK